MFWVGPGETTNTLVIEGELDLASVDQLYSAVDLCVAPADELVIDCSKLTFMDGTGARAFMDLAGKMPAQCSLVLQGASGFVLRVIELLRLDAHPRIELRS
jgi:anti-anti-sigma factor